MSDNNPFKPQVDAMKEADQVEDLLQDTAGRRDRYLEEQSR